MSRPRRIVSDRSAARIVRAYHRSSGLDPEQAPRAPSHLVRASEPIPFRRYEGAPVLQLPNVEADSGSAANGTVVRSTVPSATATSAAFDLVGLGRLFGDALGLSGWKVAANARFGLRVVPSAGNLHPIETYVVARDLEPGVAAGVYHYSPFDHALERRRRLGQEAWSALVAGTSGPHVLIALSAILWRNAWKYGERAFRLVQLDAGHVMAALAASAALAGWRVRPVPASDEALETLLGIGDRSPGLPGPEAEAAVALLAISPSDEAPRVDVEAALDAGAVADPTDGQPSRVSPRHRPWPRAAVVARAIARATRRAPAAPKIVPWPEIAAPQTPYPSTVLRRRRSRGRFDLARSLAASDLAALLSTLERALSASGVATLLFVHRVDDLVPGLYACGASGIPGELRAALRADFAWQPVEGNETLHGLAAGDARRAIQHLAGDQQAAGDAAVVFLFLGAVADRLERDGAGAYRCLHWRAGAAGHGLYLEAEFRGLAATGLSGFYDRRLADLLGLRDGDWQPLYLLGVGHAGAADPALAAADAHRAEPSVPVPPSRGGWRPADAPPGEAPIGDP